MLMLNGKTTQQRGFKYSLVNTVRTNISFLLDYFLPSKTFVRVIVCCFSFIVCIVTEIKRYLYECYSVHNVQSTQGGYMIQRLS